MAEFVVNAQRFDPYKNFKFRLKWDGRYVAGISKVQRAQADHRGRSSTETAAIPSTSRKSPGPDRVRRDHPRARRDPRHRLRGVGGARSGRSAPRSAPRSRWRTSART